VTIHNLVIENYGVHTWDAVVSPELDARGWLVVGNEIRNNAGTGIKAGNGWVVRGNWVHDNWWTGIGGEGPSITVEDNRVENNNTGRNDTEYDASATKFVRTSGLIVRRNMVVGNYGNGIWVDIDATDSKIQDNTVSGNFGAGILVEVSQGALVDGNTVEGNGYGRTVSVDGGAIVISSSRDVTVSHNTVVDNRDAIVAVSVDRTGALPADTYQVRGMTVTNNKIVMRSGRTGLVTYSGHPVFSAAYANRFIDNEYEQLDASRPAFLWNGREVTLSTWRAVGHS
jgi:parallel beta-helix repeat protein